MSLSPGLIDAAVGDVTTHSRLLLLRWLLLLRKGGREESQETVVMLCAVPFIRCKSGSYVCMYGCEGQQCCSAVVVVVTFVAQCVDMAGGLFSM